MSFLFRSSNARITEFWCSALGALIFLVGSGGPAAADEYFYVQPRAFVSTEVDSNRDMVTSGPTTTSEGYGAQAGATIGIATPESDTTIRPQLDYYDFPNLSETALEGRADFASSLNAQRNQLGISGEYDHRELFGSELASATFNSVNPYLPTTPETGRISVSGARSLLTVVPKYEYDLTQRLDLDVSGIYQNLNYSGASANYISYDYYDVSAGADWKLSPRSDLSLAVDGSSESAKDIDSVTHGHGITLTYNYQWSKVFTGSLSLVGEQYDIRIAPSNGAVIPAPSKTTSSGVGVQYTTTWIGEISQLQLIIGRTFTPSGAGGTFASDQFQAEYKRNFTPRMSLDVAAHYIQDVALSDLYDAGNYDYLIATADLKWMLTRTWFVAGGVQYVKERYPESATSAASSMAHVLFGYEGLGRQY